MMRIPFSYIWRSLWARRLTTALTLGGLALVVFVFAGVLMLARPRGDACRDRLARQRHRAAPLGGLGAREPDRSRHRERPRDAARRGARQGRAAAAVAGGGGRDQPL